MPCGCEDKATIEARDVARLPIVFFVDFETGGNVTQTSAEELLIEVPCGQAGMLEVFCLDAFVEIAWRRRFQVGRAPRTGKSVVMLPVRGGVDRLGPAGSKCWGFVQAGDRVNYRLRGLLAATDTCSPDTGLMTSNSTRRACVAAIFWPGRTTPPDDLERVYPIGGEGGNALADWGTTSANMQLGYPPGYARTMNVQCNTNLTISQRIGTSANDAGIVSSAANGSTGRSFDANPWCLHLAVTANARFSGSWSRRPQST
jgi:hypothetical protein